MKHLYMSVLALALLACPVSAFAESGVGSMLPISPSMSDAQKEAIYAKNRAKFNSLTPEQQQVFIQNSRKTPEQRAERRNAMKAQFDTMTLEQRQAYVAQQKMQAGEAYRKASPEERAAMDLKKARREAYIANLPSRTSTGTQTEK